MDKLIIFSILILCLGTILTEYKLEAEEDQWQCYRNREFRKLASDYKCKGTDKSCKRCPYKKNWEEQNERDNCNN